jgi:hypothetical protein
MPSYAHYCQTLIPHMPVPLGSIHLHTHSPSVLTSLSGSRQQAESGSLRACSWCWALSGRNHFLANSFTWKELLTGQQASHSPELRATTNTGKNRHRLPKNRFNSHMMFSRSRFQNRAPCTSSLNFSWENRDSSLKLTWTFHSGNAHTGFLSPTDSMALNKVNTHSSAPHTCFPPVTDIHEVSCRLARTPLLSAVGSNGMREPPPP